MSDAHHPIEGEQWQPGDLVLDAAGGLFTRAGRADEAEGRPWGYPADQARLVTGETHVPEGSVPETAPARPLTLLARDGRPALPAVPDDASSVTGTAAADAAASTGVGGLFLAATAFDPDGAGDSRAAKLRASLLDSVVIVDSPQVLTEMFGGAADGLLVELADWHERSMGESA
ncbi:MULTISPECIES: hypothetical protein [Streptosporangium]|uniref:Uncharacterized protein n=1 Tax=Streptosporangium brasiliense TaxID=47480 RepID=A0ABT9RFR3_9ACTN|nr:hypothetical protein [Streptosporangium brasiliense]MDP9868111.1 hypothetical protein [Streptosporangium brasiliense]